MKIHSLIVLLSGLLLLGCTRPQSEKALVKISAPQLSSNAQNKSIQKLHALSNDGGNWGLTDPTSLDEMKCYAIFVGGDQSSLKGNSCTYKSDSAKFEFGPTAGLFSSGESISLELPVGSKRQFYVLGFSSQSVCEKLNSPKELNTALYSNPFLIGNAVADLVPGENTVTIDVSFLAENKISDCSFFDSDKGPGNDSISNYGTGFDGNLVISTAQTLILSQAQNPQGTKYTSSSRVLDLNSQSSEIMSFQIEDQWDLNNIKVNDEVMFYVAAGNSCGTLFPGYKNFGQVSGFDFLNRKIYVKMGDQNRLTSITAALLSTSGNKTGSFCRVTLTRVPQFNSISVSANATVYPFDQGFGSLNNQPVASTGKLFSGSYQTCLRYQNNQLKCWGDNGYGTLGYPSNISPILSPPNYYSKTDFTGVNKISFGYGHACVIDLLGQVKCWGYGSSGQLGYGNTVSTFSYPATGVSNISSPTDIASGHSHTCSVHSSGQVSCWGNGGLGQLGNGSTADQTSPTAISLGGATAYKLALGNSFSCVHLTSPSQSIKCWGHNYYGQIGDGTTTQRNTPTMTATEAGGIILLRTGYAHACYTHDSGSLKCWGKNDFGQVGNSTVVHQYTPTSISTGLGNISYLALGNDFTCAANTTQVACWGQNTFGQLGLGGTTQRNLPTLVSIPSGTITDMAAGANHVCITYSDERVYCWGYNNQGALGTGINSLLAYGDNAGETPVSLQPLVFNGHRGGSFAMRVKDSITVSNNANFQIDISGKGFTSGNAANLPGEGLIGYDGTQTTSSNGNGGGGHNGDLPGGGGHGGIGGKGNGISNGGSTLGDEYGCSNQIQDLSMKCLIGKIFFGGGGGSASMPGTNGGGFIIGQIQKINISSGNLSFLAEGKSNDEASFTAATGAGGAIFVNTSEVQITDTNTNRLNFYTSGGNVNTNSSNLSGTGSGGRVHLRVTKSCTTVGSNAISLNSQGGYVNARASSASDGETGTAWIEGTCPP